MEKKSDICLALETSHGDRFRRLAILAADATDLYALFSTCRRHGVEPLR